MMPSGLHTAIVADDFTSAMDGAGPFAARGCLARVRCREPLRAGGAQVLAVDADTRRMDGAAAEARTARIVRALPRAPVLVKTVDSTLRGHVGREVSTALKASGRALAVIAPAFPAAGRTTREGMQLLAGTPVADTVFGRDRRHPSRTSVVSELFGGDSAIVSLPRGFDELPRAGVCVVDAHSDEDLDRLARMGAMRDDLLWVGSPGLAHALARRVPFTDGAPSVGSARVIFVLGSRHPINGAALGRLGATLPGLVTVVDVDGDARSLSLPWESETVVLRPAMAAAEIPIEPDAIARNLAETTRQLVQRGSFGAIVATGGETARAVMQALGADRVDLLGELEPGIVVGRLDDAQRSLFVTKAGGFGDHDVLARILCALTSNELP
jgi:D-threonate/D-erythronate kinase